MTEEKKDQKRKPLGLKLDQAPKKPDSDALKRDFSRGRSKTVTVEVKRNRRQPVTSAPQSDSKFTQQEEMRRMRAVQGALQSRMQEEQERQERERQEAARRIEEIRLLEEKKAEEALRQQEKSKEVPVGRSAPLVAGRKADAKPAADVRSAVKGQKPIASGVGVRRDRPAKKVEEPVKVFGDRKVKTDDKRSKRKGRDQEDVDTLKVVFSDQSPVHTHPRVVGLKKLRFGSRKLERKSSVVVEVEISGPVSVHDLAEQLAVKSASLLKVLLKMGHPATLNTILEPDIAEIVAAEMGAKSVRVVSEDLEEKLWQVPTAPDKRRPPVVTVMGHVDHGKTSLLDALRKTSVVSGEKGGITQHIGAYQVVLPSGDCISFIDTPGHEAFAQMRARGANVTDIVVLVVAADDGVNAQTVEAIRHAQSAGVPIIVAINKIDKPTAKPEHIRTQLLSYDLVVESLGGDCLEVEVSALTGKNLDKLEQAIILQAEVLDLKTDSKAWAKGVVIESEMKKGLGSVATVLIKDGTLRKGDFFVSGEVHGRVRLLFDDKGKMIQSAEAGMPVAVSGFSQLPSSGERFMKVGSEAEAKQFVEWKHQAFLSKGEPAAVVRTLESHLQAQKVKELSVILKADVQGSLEGLEFEISKLLHEEVSAKIMYKGVGAVTETDALLAQTCKGIVVAFGVSILPEAQKIIEKEAVPLLKHNIIYHAVDQIRDLLSGMLAPDLQEILLGQAEVIQVFKIKKGPTVGGCAVKKGFLRRGETVKITRDGKLVFQGLIKSLKHQKDDKKEVKEGYEAGIVLDGHSDYQLGDQVSCYEVKTIARKI
jgi:translation initiation factor IF-2